MTSDVHILSVQVYLVSNVKNLQKLCQKYALVAMVMD